MPVCDNPPPHPLLGCPPKSVKCADPLFPQQKSELTEAETPVSGLNMTISGFSFHMFFMSLSHFASSPLLLWMNYLIIWFAWQTRKLIQRWENAVHVEDNSSPADQTARKQKITHRKKEVAAKWSCCRNPQDFRPSNCSSLLQNNHVMMLHELTDSINSALLNFLIIKRHSKFFLPDHISGQLGKVLRHSYQSAGKRK